MNNKPYTARFHCVDDAGLPYANTKYTVYFNDGSFKKGKTDENGYTPVFGTDQAEEISLHLEVPNQHLNLDILGESR